MLFSSAQLLPICILANVAIVLLHHSPTVVKCDNDSGGRDLHADVTSQLLTHDTDSALSDVTSQSVRHKANTEGDANNYHLKGEVDPEGDRNFVRSQILTDEEDCPVDSVWDAKRLNCVCRPPEQCPDSPSCLHSVVVHFKGNSTPGFCCPQFRCDGCPLSERIHNQCPCAVGAILNTDGKCKCIDPERSLKEQECHCNPNLCNLPPVCGENAILVEKSVAPVASAISDSDTKPCCTHYDCIECPPDSSPTTYNSQHLEDKCVCNKCPEPIQCQANQTRKLLVRGKGFPENCCDVEICQDIVIAEQSCQVENNTYSDGASWIGADGVGCKCQNGISLCTSKQPTLNDCSYEGIWYKHNEWWNADADNCTNCTCINGETKCISHWCEFKETKLKPNLNECNHSAMDGETTANSSMAFFQCQLDCSERGGFVIDEKGCRLCECLGTVVASSTSTEHGIVTTDTSEIDQEHRKTIWVRYNLTLEQLIEILEKRKQDLAATSTPDAPTQNGTTENTTTYIVHEACNDALFKWIFGTVSMAFICIFLGVMAFLKRASRRKGSYDPVPMKVGSGPLDNVCY